MQNTKYTSLQRRIWRWHFYAGLMVIPFAILLACTGSIYLFKTEFNAFVEADINAQAPTTTNQQALPADDLLATALAQHPNSKLNKIFLPKTGDRSIEFELETANATQLVWVDSLSNTVLHQTQQSRRFMNIIKKLHSELLLGNRGSLIVELMASWMIVLIITGIVLYFPRPFFSNLYRTLVPTFKGMTHRQGWRQIHGTIGVWCGALILLLLISGLPWTQVWGEGFHRLQKTMGWDGPGQEWFVTLQSGHTGATPKTLDDGLALWERGSKANNNVSLQSQTPTDSHTPLPLQDILNIVTPEQLPPPVEVYPPKGENGVWTVRSMIQNRPQRVTIHYDRWTGEEIMRIRFSDYHPVKQTASLGIALHEGALFGLANQLLGLLTALAIITLTISGSIMWWRRRPQGQLGAPAQPTDKRLSNGAIASIIVLAACLPMVAISIMVMLSIDFLGHLISKSRFYPVRDS